jgi:hypothetical protein
MMGGAATPLPSIPTTAHRLECNSKRKGCWLKRHGLKETEASITNKLARGTFPATFFLACLAALELDGVALEEI